EAEVEVEHVRLREQLEQRPPLGRLAAQEAAAPVERPVRLRVKRIALEHDEPGVDAATTERLHVRPRHPGRVDRAVDDAQPAVRSLGLGWLHHDARDSTRAPPPVGRRRAEARSYARRSVPQTFVVWPARCASAVWT